MTITAAQAANKWRERLQASTQQITDGVNAVTQAPGAAAAARKDLWLQRIQMSADKWARNVAAVSLDEWKRSMIDVGIQRIGTGAQAKVGKVERFMTEFLPHVEAGAQRVRAMPKGGLPESINRAVAMIQHNAQFKRQSR